MPAGRRKGNQWQAFEGKLYMSRAFVFSLFLFLVLGAIGLAVGKKLLDLYNFPGIGPLLVGKLALTRNQVVE